jgi:hypothetical protein
MPAKRRAAVCPARVLPTPFYRRSTKRGGAERRRGWARSRYPLFGLRCVGLRYLQVSVILSKSTVTTPFALRAKCWTS